MPRIAGVDIPEDKRIDIALTKLYGVGRRNVVKILRQAAVDASKRTRDLTEDEISRIQKTVDQGVKIEGDLRQQVSENIKRLKQIGSYRGKRHIANLPVRGQRTRSNARTKRGKRVTIGALKKEELARKTTAEAMSGKTETKKETKSEGKK